MLSGFPEQLCSDEAEGSVHGARVLAVVTRTAGPAPGPSDCPGSSPVCVSSQQVMWAAGPGWPSPPLRSYRLAYTLSRSILVPALATETDQAPGPERTQVRAFLLGARGPAQGHHGVRDPPSRPRPAGRALRFSVYTGCALCADVDGEGEQGPRTPGEKRGASINFTWHFKAGGSQAAESKASRGLMENLGFNH